MSGPYLCTEILDGVCQAWGTSLDVIAPYEELGVTAESIMTWFAFGAGSVLSTFIIGLVVGTVIQQLNSVARTWE